MFTIQNNWQTLKTSKLKLFKEISCALKGNSALKIKPTSLTNARTKNPHKACNYESYYAVIVLPDTTINVTKIFDIKGNFSGFSRAKRAAK